MKKEKTTQFLMKPKVDFCFKELMEDEEVRNAFLAAVLGINLEEIVESRILPSHLRQKDKDDKLGILDVRVLLNNKEQIDIEIQVTSSEYWAERTLFYLGKMFVDQLKPGEDYQKLEKCIHVGILNFTLFDDEEYYSRFHFWSDQGRKMYSDKFEIHTLELPKLAKHEYPETELLKWLQFINAETVDQHIIIWHFRRIKLCRNNAGIFHPRTPGILVITVIEKIITVITRLKMGYFNFPDSANYGIK